MESNTGTRRGDHNLWTVLKQSKMKVKETKVTPGSEKGQEGESLKVLP